MVKTIRDNTPVPTRLLGLVFGHIGGGLTATEQIHFNARPRVRRFHFAQIINSVPLSYSLP